MVFSAFLGGALGASSVSIVIRGIDDFSKTFTKAQFSISSLGGAIGKLSLAGGIALGAIGAASIRTAIQFESAFAGVRKTVNLTEGQFKELDQRFKDISETVPISYVELAKIGELAGQLGVEGVDNITKFTKTIADISRTTNLTSEMAATDFARIANIMNEPISNVDRMGAAVVDLGNNFATTESEITDFAQRIAGAGALAGFSTSDIFALGTAFSSVGVEAEAGGTAVQKVLSTMIESVSDGGEKLDLFAQTAGMTASEFSDLFERDAAKAFENFVLGLGRQGDNAFKTLDNLDLKDARLTRSFLSLANAGDLITRTLETGEKAWETNSALTTEANKRYDTLESKLTTLKNKFEIMGAEIGENLTPTVSDLIKTINDNDQAIKTFASTLGTVLVKGIDLVVQGLGQLDDQITLSASFIQALFSKDRSMKDVELFRQALKSYNSEVKNGNTTLSSWVNSNKEYADVLSIIKEDVREQIESNIEHGRSLDVNSESQQKLIGLMGIGTNIAERSSQIHKILSNDIDNETKSVKENTNAVTENNKALETQIALKKKAMLRGSLAIAGVSDSDKAYRDESGIYQSGKYGTARPIGSSGSSSSSSGGSSSGGSTSVNDFIITKRGDVLKTSPDDYIFGMKKPESLMEKKDMIMKKPESLMEKKDMIMKKPESLMENININMLPNKAYGDTKKETIIIISDNNIYGTDPDDIAMALQRKLTNMISI